MPVARRRTKEPEPISLFSRPRLSSRMRLLAFHQRRLSVSLARYTRRWWVRSDRHLHPTCLADHVRAKRLKDNLTMKELARYLGIGHMSLKFYEMHKSPPTGSNRGALVEYLGFDPEAAEQPVNIWPVDFR